MSKKLKISQENPEEHSEVKVLLLKKYMEAYINILANARQIKGVVLHDLFCGPGKYTNDKLGSPLILLNEIIRAHTRDDIPLNSSTSFECYFNDYESDKTNRLNEEINSIKILDELPVSVSVSNDDYRNILPDVINKYAKLSNKRAFAFIDPYGYKDIRVNDIQLLLKSKKSEVLLFLPTQFMYRFSENGTPESLSTFIEELGLEFSSKESGISFIEKIKEGFRGRLSADHFVDSFIIQREKNQFFALFFFTSHILGFERMLKAKWSIDEHEGRGWQPKAQADLFTIIEEDPEIRPLEDRLKEYIKAKPRSNREIYEFTLRSGFLPSHAINVLNSLNIVVKSGIGAKVRKGAFYLNSRDWKNNPDKITIELN